ncbi:MAG: hypothetical protein H7338_18485, partial [Candidatus Sericytochromatia bacterium]|nr:hypothetical protein [Candidatus Sericytochromatia bacterium]
LGQRPPAAAAASLPADLDRFIQAATRGGIIPALLDRIMAASGGTQAMIYAFPELIHLGGQGPDGATEAPDSLPEIVIQALTQSETAINVVVPDGLNWEEVADVQAVMAVPLDDCLVVVSASAADRLFTLEDAGAIRDLAPLLSLARADVPAGA